MMTKFFVSMYVGTAVFLIMAKKALNPVKLCTIMAFTSLMMMATLYAFKGSSWFSWTFALLFLGGILIMFLILSSLMPNHKPGKVKTGTMMCLAAMWIAPLDYTSADHQITESSKWLTTSSWNFFMIILIIILYFLAFMSALKSAKNSMRGMLP